jgi:hypothetical protein
MLVDPSNSAAGSSVTGAIRQASQATGTSFTYLLATAKVESGLNPQAGAATSSARGLFQFIEQTWLATIKQAGSELGYGRYADAITKTRSGRYEVRDPAMRSEILRLRNDPTANAVMAGAITRANAAYLTHRLGRPPSEGELYIAHFLGAGGASRLIALAAANPNAKAKDFFPGAAHANTPIFYDRTTGTARSLTQVRDVLTARYDVAARSQPGAPVGYDTAARSRPGGPTRAAPVAAMFRTVNAAAMAMAPDTAGIANAFAAATRGPAAPPPTVSGSAVPASAEVAAAPPAAHRRGHQIFQGLFQDGDRTAPFAPVVSELWGVPKATPAASNASAPTPASAPAPAGDNMMLDLFRDPVKGT